MKGYLTVLCDYGLDDAVATCRIFERYREFSKIDVLAVGGNVPPDVSLRNLRTLASRFELDGRVTLVDTCEVGQNCEELYNIHGADGMGGILEPAGCALRCVDFESWLSGYDGCDILLSLGPMTVTEKILKKAKPAEFIFMAGNIAAEPNYNGYEFNEGINPKAFSACVRYPHKAVTLDTGAGALDIMNREPDKTTLRGVLADKYRQLSAERNEEHCYVWDEIAVRYMFCPEDFTEKTETDKNGNTVNRLIYRGKDDER